MMYFWQILLITVLLFIVYVNLDLYYFRNSLEPSQIVNIRFTDTEWTNRTIIEVKTSTVVVLNEEATFKVEISKNRVYYLDVKEEVDESIY